MSRQSGKIAFITAVCATGFIGQGISTTQGTSSKAGVPLYRVTVVEHGMDAVNYQYRSGATRIDFVGTVLLSKAKGEATVQSQRGRTDIDAKFENLVPPSRFGGGYLTYVLWAISPEGASWNLGEIIPDGSNRGRLRVTTDLSTFAMIVTAEPYAAVRQPGDVVTLENQVRRDTIGKIVPVRIRPELMPRGSYTWQAQVQPESQTRPRRVSMSQYEATLELYQAQNAVAIARAENAEHYAPESLETAQSALTEAQRLQSIKADKKLVIQSARQATQAAEDARTITDRRKEREGGGAARAAAPPREPAPPANEANRVSTEQPLRSLLHRRLDGSLLSQDTPGGMVIVLPDNSFDGANLLSSVSEKLGPVASSLLSQPNVHVQVDGYIDNGELQSWERAQAVRNQLVASGLAANQISIRGGASAPGSRDRRVQIIISVD